MTANTNLASSPDSSSDSSITNNQPLYDFSLNMDAENCLPTVVCIIYVFVRAQLILSINIIYRSFLKIQNMFISSYKCQTRVLKLKMNNFGKLPDAF